MTPAKTIEIADGYTLEITDAKGMDKNALLAMYWQFHPRFRFFKTATKNARLLDVGASNGGIVFWTRWGQPDRSDLKLYAVDMEKGEFFDKFEDYEVLNLDTTRIGFPGLSFQAIMVSHVLEHLRNPEPLLDNLFDLLEPGGRLYVEIPTPATKVLPSQAAYKAQGLKATTMCFYDDSTHVETYSLDTLTSMVSNAGFQVLESGYVENKYLDDAMISYGFEKCDGELTSYGLWLKYTVSQYCVSRKD